MTDDPKRWSDDESAPTAMRDFLRDARLDAPTLDDETRRRVRQRLVRAPSTNARVVLGFVLVAAAAGLLLWLGDGPTPDHLIALDPDRADAGPHDAALGDAPPTLEPIRVERTCGEEDVDYACDVQVETSRVYERVELHEARGVAPPSCDGPRVAAEWVTRTSETHLTIESGAAYDSQLSVRACAYERDVLVATGAVEGTRSVPMLDARASEEADGSVAYDLRVALGDGIDDDAMSLAVVRQDHAEASDDGFPITCAGEVVVEIPRAAAMVFDDLERVALPIHVAGSSRTSTFALCVRDASGALTTETDVGARVYAMSPDGHVPMVLTPSGEIPLDTIEVGHRVVTRVRAVQRAWTTPGPMENWLLDVVDRIDLADEGAIHRLRLSDGRWATLPSFAHPWSQERGAFVAIDDLRVGEHLLTAHDHELVVEEITTVSDDSYRTYGEPVLADPASYFLDGVLVGGRHTRQRTLVSHWPPSSLSALETWPARADDCAVRVTLDVGLDTLRAQGVSSVVIAFAPHRGAAGTLQEVDCATARIGFEASLAELTDVPTSGAGRRQLSIDMPPLDTSEDPDAEPHIECDAGYAVTSCVRDASGLHGYGAHGRWTRSGPSCFAGTTVIATADGPRAIASLRPGDAIRAYDSDSHRIVMARVDRLISRGERPILALVLSSGAVLRVTAEHPLFDARSGSFRAASTFAIGDALRDEDGADVVVIGVHDAGHAHVYDLSVNGPHTFVADGVIVHNY